MAGAEVRPDGRPRGLRGGCPRASTHTWHRVSLAAAGVDDETVNLAWATGPGYDRTVTARIILGAKFKTDKDASIGFGYYPGLRRAGSLLDHAAPLHRHHRGPTRLRQTRKRDHPTSTPTPSVTDTPAAPSSGVPGANTGTQLAATGDHTGLLAATAATLTAAGGAVLAATRRRNQHH